MRRARRLDLQDSCSFEIGTLGDAVDAAVHRD